ncbi:hypothetical protein TELCIR_14168, partial [Teladorsagia circumcincta]
LKNGRYKRLGYDRGHAVRDEVIVVSRITCRPDGNTDITGTALSPALESIRRASIHVLQKLGVSKKREHTIPLQKDMEIDLIPLEACCKRPREFFQEPKPFSFRDLGRVARLPEYDPFCPVHGSRRRFARRQHLVTMQHLMTSVDHDEMPESAGYLYNQDFLAKIIRKKKRAMLSGNEKIKVAKTMQKIKTSVNNELGADSLAVLYLSLAVSSLFVPTYMINRLGCKLTLIVAMSSHVFYMAVNIRPSYSSLLPASVLAGIAGSCLWGAKCAYITEMGIRYARVNFESQNTVIVRFFGYFFMIVHGGQVFGNLLSSFIMTAAMKTPQPLDQVYKTCGHAFPSNLSELTEIAAQNLERPNNRVYLSVCLTFLASAIVAVMIVSMFLNALHKDVVNRQRLCDLANTVEANKISMTSVVKRSSHCLAVVRFRESQEP